MKYLLQSTKTLLILGIAFFSSCNKDAPKTTPQTPTSRTLDYVSEVSFLKSSGEVISTIQVAEAREPEERNEGLMDVLNLPENKGMIFHFEQEEPLSFWMANTPLPLDIIFVNSDSTIVRIHHNTQPFSEGQLPSEEPAQYVVEVNAGYCMARDIKEGDKVRF